MTLKRSGLVRRTPLRAVSPRREAKAREAGVVLTSTFGPAARRRPSPRPRLDNPDPHTVDLVLERDNFSCSICGMGVSGVRGVDWSIHHRLRRSQGGTHAASNLVLLCGNGTQGHHGVVHGAPKGAREGGFLVPLRGNPLEVPMLHIAYGGRVLLTDDGRAIRLGERGAA